MEIELLIQNGNTLHKPLIQEGVQWTTERKGVPGKLTFKVVKDGVVNFQEGNPISLKVNGANVFYGFVFTKKRDKQHIIDVVAYDQIRYLKNKDTLVYTNKTASDVIRTVAAVKYDGVAYGIQLGEIEETSFIIPKRNEPDTSLMDMIYTALDLELTNKGKMYILYDDFGKLTLKSLDNFKVDLLIDEETGENFDYTSTIDEATYNRINLFYENEDTGKRDRYVAYDSNNINNWGVLQYHDTLKAGENGQAKADALLKLYNAKTRKLKITKAFGDTRIRAGSMPIISLNLGDVVLKNYLLVEKCVHTFNESEHWMDLHLRGGEFVG